MLISRSWFLSCRLRLSSSVIVCRRLRSRLALSEPRAGSFSTTQTHNKITEVRDRGPDHGKRRSVSLVTNRRAFTVLQCIWERVCSNSGFVRDRGPDHGKRRSVSLVTNRPAFTVLHCIWERECSNSGFHTHSFVRCERTDFNRLKSWFLSSLSVTHLSTGRLSLIDSPWRLQVARYAKRGRLTASDSSCVTTAVL